MVMSCNEIASKLGSTHKCNRRKCISRTSKNPITLYSTKKSQHHEFMTALYERMTGKIIEYGRSSRSMITEIENEFGHEFECCKNHRNLILKNINLCKKRKAEKNLEIALQRKKRKNNEEEKNEEPPTVVIEDDSLSDGYNTEDEELVSIMSSPALSKSPQQQQTQQNITTPESNNTITTGGSEYSCSLQRIVPRPLDFDHYQSTSSQITNNQKKKRKSSKSVFLNRFTELKKSYYKNTVRKKCSELHPNRYVSRCDIALCHLLCMSGFVEDEIQSIKDNLECFNEVVSLLSGIKARLIKHTGLTISSAERMTNNENPDVCDLCPPPHQDENEDEIPTKSENSEYEKEIESLLVAQLPKHSYNKVAQLQKKCSNIKFTSYKELSKTLPTVKEMSCEYEELVTKEAANSEVGDDGTMVPNRENNPTSGGVAAIQNQQAVPDHRAQRPTTTELKIVKADGAYVEMVDCINLLFEKIKSVIEKVDGMTMENAIEKGYFVTCADGAQHNRLPKDDRNIITYSITFVSRTLMEKFAIYPSSSKWILPHVQLRAKENIETLRSVLRFRLSGYKKIQEKNELFRFIPMYDIADGKALYIYTEHSHWASSLNPFLLCKCERGQDPSTICQIVQDDEYKKLYEKSKERWDKKPELDELRARQRRRPYTKTDHKKWCSQANEGVSHFGSLSSDYCISNLWLDVFHGRGGIIKVILKYIRNLMEGLECQNYKVVSLFAAFLRKLKHWDLYVIDPFISNDAQSRLKGNHTKEFLKNAHKAIAVLKSLVAGEQVEDICACLEAFYMMSKIVSIYFIDVYENVKDILLPNSTVSLSSNPADVAEATFLAYEHYAKLLYVHGEQSVLTRFTRGDSETFYFHCFRWYVPRMMRKMYRLHGLGIAVMTMEGFEHKNFTSKHAIQRRTNGKGNVTKQSMKILHLFFKSGYHNVMRELQKRLTEENNDKDDSQRTNDVSVDKIIDDYLLTLV